MMSRLCVIIPTYNNGGTIARVVDEVWPHCHDIIVVDDGCTDNTREALQACAHSVSMVSYAPNRGKGHALQAGFRRAMAMGYTHAITIDADGQHFASDIPALVAQMHKHPDAIVVGNRNLNEANMPRGNTFANKFSNFWFRLQTGVNLADTQSGYRLYPLMRLHGLGLITSRYEAELELLVLAAWHGTSIVSVPVRVYYPPAAERVTHFRPIYDFARISLLNVILCIGALVYGLPMRVARAFECVKNAK